MELKNVSVTERSPDGSWGIAGPRIESVIFGNPFAEGVSLLFESEIEVKYGELKVVTVGFFV